MRLFTKIMRTVVAAGAVLCLASIAQANSLIPSLIGGAPVANGGGAGIYRWNYRVDLSEPSYVTNTDDFLTMYDWHNIIAAHSSNDAIWTPSIQALGRTAIDTTPTDSAAVNNVTFTYHGGVPVPGPQVAIFTFYIDSTIGTLGTIQYTGQDHNKDLGTLEGNIGRVRGAAVPEPVFFQLSALLGMGGLGLLKLRKKKA